MKHKQVTSKKKGGGGGGIESRCQMVLPPVYCSKGYSADSKTCSGAPRDFLFVFWLSPPVGSVPKSHSLPNRRKLSRVILLLTTYPKGGAHLQGVLSSPAIKGGLFRENPIYPVPSCPVLSPPPPLSSIFRTYLPPRSTLKPISRGMLRCSLRRGGGPKSGATQTKGRGFHDVPSARVFSFAVHRSDRNR